MFPILAQQSRCLGQVTVHVAITLGNSSASLAGTIKSRLHGLHTSDGSQGEIHKNARGRDSHVWIIGIQTGYNIVEIALFEVSGSSVNRISRNLQPSENSLQYRSRISAKLRESGIRWYGRNVECHALCNECDATKIWTFRANVRTMEV